MQPGGYPQQPAYGQQMPPPGGMRAGY